MNTILLFGMPGSAELFFIVLVIIMLFGAKKIPELARGLGKGIREIKRATGDIQREIREGARDINSIKDKVNVEKQVKDLIAGKKQSAVDSPQSSDLAKQQTTSNEQPVPQTVQRKSPYAKNEPVNTTAED